MDGLPIYSADVDGESVDFLALSTDTNADDVLEMVLVRLLVRLRSSDVDAFELVWELAEMLDNRGPALDALEG